MMSKPTVFFSHSSKDKEQILAIRDKLGKATKSVIDIFLSSDGQSIPCGTNWVHKVEQGLQDATLMFVFATENSIRSGWIFFEAGFAYSRGIKVIPIGLGVDINELKPPLSLLQGFNVESADSLNNIIAVINREFNYSLEEAFSTSDYMEIAEKAAFAPKYRKQFDEIVVSADYTIKSEFKNLDGSITTCDTCLFFNSIISYLDQNSISYSRTTEYRYQGQSADCIVVRGVKILFITDKAETTYIGGTQNIPGFLRFVLSTIDFESSFSMLKEILQQMKDNRQHYLVLHFQPNMQFISKDEDLSSIMSKYPDEFVVRKESINRFIMKPTNVRFQVFETSISRGTVEHVVGIPFTCEELDASSIISLIMRLVCTGVIKPVE